MAEPKVRFKKDDGRCYPEWISTPIGTIYRKVNEKNDLSFGRNKIISVANMFFKGSDDRDSLDDEYMKTYNVMRLGDIAFEGHENKEHQYGRFVANTIGDGIVSHIFVVLRPVGVNHNQQYWQYVINNEKVLGPVLRHSTKKSTMMHDLVIDDFLKRRIAVPCLEEQQKIADFLSSVDAVIATSEQEVANLETQKKAVMKKIFSQEVHFKRADGSDFPEWCTCALRDVFTERNETSIITDDYPLLSFTIEEGVIDPKDKKTNKRDYLMKDKDAKKFKKTELDDIIYNPSNMKFGAIHRNKLCKGLVSPIYAIFSSKVNPIFMEYVVSDSGFIKRSQKLLEGTVVKLRTLKPEAFLNMEVVIPNDPEEQRLIADFLSDFDDAIAAAKKELELWKELKKGLLQQMFV